MSMMSSTPSTPASASSTSSAPSDTDSRSVPESKVWVTMTMFWPVLPRKSTFSRGMRDTVSTSSSAEATTVMTGCFWVPRSTGL